MHGAECTERRLEESWRKVAEGSIHYYNHFTSLEKVALRAAAVRERRRKRQETERERGRRGKRKRDEWREKPLMAVSKSEAQLHFSTFIAFSHEYPEHPHNKQRHSSGISLSPSRVCNILELP